MINETETERAMAARDVAEWYGGEGPPPPLPKFTLSNATSDAEINECDLLRAFASGRPFDRPTDPPLTAVGGRLPLRSLDWYYVQVNALKIGTTALALAIGKVFQSGPGEPVVYRDGVPWTANPVSAPNAEESRATADDIGEYLRQEETQ